MIESRHTHTGKYHQKTAVFSLIVLRGIFKANVKKDLVISPCDISQYLLAVLFLYIVKIQHYYLQVTVTSARNCSVLSQLWGCYGSVFNHASMCGSIYCISMCGRLGGRAAHTLITRSGIRSSAPPQCTCGNALGQHDEPKKLPLIHPSMCVCVCVCVCVYVILIFF